MSSIAPLLLSPKQVNDLTKSSTPVTVLDSTWFMPNSLRNAKAEYLSKRIPGSQFLDLDEVASSHDLGLKHMMPDSKTFALACGMCVVFHLYSLKLTEERTEKLGITPTTHVVM